MADEKKPFRNAFEELEALKKRLPKTRKAAEEAARPPEPKREPEPEAPTDEPDADFGEAMKEMGVDRLDGGTDRVEAKRPLPTPARQPAQKRPRSVHSGFRGADDGFDGSSPKIDLHGMTVDAALAEVKRMAAVWRKAGITKARIVTGKGSHSGDGRAAIREAVEDWLRQAPGAVGVYRARPDAGGEGVVLFEQQGKGRKA